MHLGRRHSAWAVAAIAVGGVACDQRLHVASDVLWKAEFEGDNFDEYTTTPGGSVSAFPSSMDTATVSSQRVHGGRYAAKLSINASDGAQHNAGLNLAGDLPAAGYYSAWYYLPESVKISGFWTIFKFRMRTAANDASTEAELFDLDLSDMSSGEMTLLLYDHRSGEVPLDVAAPVVPVGVWFQIEAYYRNASDATGRLTYWLNGKQLVDVAGPTSPTPWVEWNAVNVAQNVTPAALTLYIDDCAVSLARVGPEGIIGP
jgi:hypothetical protein